MRLRAICRCDPMPAWRRASPTVSLRRIVDLIWNLGFDELRKQGQGFLPAEIASLGWDDRRHAFLNNGHVRADGYSPEGNRRLHFPRQLRVVELVCIANTLVRLQFEIGPAKRVTLAAAEVGE